MSASRSRASRRLLLVVSDLEFGGAQRQAVELCNHLDPGRYEVHLCSLSSYMPLAERLRIPPERVHVVERRGKWDFSVVSRLRGLLRQLGADVVQSYLFDASIACRLGGRLAGTSVIVDSERNCFNVYRRRHRIAYRLTRRFVDLVIANSSAGRDFHRMTQGLPAERYRVVHNGVSTARFRPADRQAARRALGLEERECVVGMFASFKAQKNHELFLRAMPAVRQRFPAVRILLVGDELHGGGSDSGEQKRRIQAWIREFALDDCCTCLGNREDVEAIYPACDLTVLPSLFEGTPNAALEAMACGIPVVATEVSDNAYVIPHGKAGYLVAPGDCEALSARIIDLLSDPAKRKAMGATARRWVETEFSCRRLAERTADAYDEALLAKAR